MNQNWKLFGVLTGLLACAIAEAAGGAENLLKNPGLLQKGISGLAGHWEIRCQKPFAVAATARGVTLDTRTAGSDIAIIQRQLPGGGAKQCRCVISGQGEYRLYIGWKMLADGKITAFSLQPTGWRKAREAAENIAFAFNPVPGALDTYWVLQTRGAARLTVSGMFYGNRIAEAAPANGNLLRNPEFRRNTGSGEIAGWTVRTPKPEGVSVSPSGVLRLDPVRGGGTVTVIQRELPNTGKQRFSVSVAGSGRYRVYVEWKIKVAGKTSTRAVQTAWRQAGAAASRIEFDFTPIPGTHPYLVMQAADSAVDFALPELRNAPAAPEVKALGVAWKINGAGSAASDAQGSFVRLRHVSNYLPGGTLAPVKIIPGKSYELSVRVIGVGPSSSLTGFHGFHFRARVPGVREPMLSDWDDVWNSSWQTKRFRFTAPAGAKSCALEFFVSQGGTAAFRDPELRIVEPEREERWLKVIAPSYAKSFFATSPEREIIARAEGASTARFQLTQNGKILADETVAAGKSFRFPVNKLAFGSCTLSVVDGKRTSTMILNRFPPAGQEVICAGNRGFLVNGKPFLPVCVWSFAKHLPNDREAVFGYAAANGVNLFISGGASTAALLDQLNAAHRHGMMMALACQYTLDASPDGIAKWLQRLENLLTPEIRRHPALFCYFLADEPMWAGVPLKNLTESYRALKRLDPYHPVWINAAPRGTVAAHRRYSAAADIYGVDVYPVPYGSHSGLDDKTPSAIGKYALRMAEAVDGAKPIIIAEQGFSWGYDRDSRPYPTYREARFMAYDALVNGAFPSWWGLDYVHRTDFFDVLFQVTREIADMREHFLSGRKIADRRFGTVRCVEYELNGKRWTVALNASTKPAELKMQPGLQVWGENRVSAAIEKFPPFEVRLYSAAAAPALRPAPSGVNQWARAVQRLASLKNYTGSAQWIWDADTVNVQGGRAVLTCRFTIDRPPRRAIFRAAADDAAVLYLDGKRIGETAGWSILLPFELANLKPGTHELRVEAADAGHLPCGFLAELELVSADGSRRIIPSDHSWRAGKKPAHVIAPNGGGKWGKRVLLVPDVFETGK